MAKEIPEHRDKLGRLLKIGDCIAYPVSNSLMIGKVEKLNPKMVGIKTLGKSWGPTNRYPREVVLLDCPEVTAYLLKNSV